MSKIIDISKWNYPIDWDAVVKAGVTGVIIRAGSGVTEDERMKYFATEVIKRGLDMGFYWFVYIHSGRTISANCIKFEQTIRPYKNKINLGIWCDFEYDTEEQGWDMDDSLYLKNPDPNYYESMPDEFVDIDGYEDIEKTDREKEAYLANPFGFKVTQYSVSYAGSPRKSYTAMETAKRVIENMEDLIW